LNSIPITIDVSTSVRNFTLNNTHYAGMPLTFTETINATVSQIARATLFNVFDPGTGEAICGGLFPFVWNSNIFPPIPPYCARMYTVTTGVVTGTVGVVVGLITTRIPAMARKCARCLLPFTTH